MTWPFENDTSAVEKKLAQAGFKCLEEKEEWNLVKGKDYYVKRNDSSLMASRIPEDEMNGFHIVASHSDSPCFKIKENPEITVEDKYIKLNVEKYGGMILSTWLDRPLSVAGRVVAAGKEAGIAESTVAVNRDLLIIPNVAIHMNREMNKGVEYNVQTDMLPLYAMEKEGNTLNSLAQKQKTF